jgi:CheY-like chemotaxis protein
MLQATKVLTIDDDKLIHKMVLKSVSEDYQVIIANDGLEGLSQAESEMPDIILLDIEMPGMNGYETCVKLKQNPVTQPIPVMFLSSLASEKSRMKGFEAGASDFLLKPFNKIELQKKLNALREHIISSKQLNQQIQQATHTAYMAMRGSSELGMAIQFIEASYEANNNESLASNFFGVTKNLDLQCTLMFNLENERIFFYCDGQPSPLEEEVISTIFDGHERFTDFDNRTQINYPRVALLVKNMPLDNPEMYGRLKDFLPTMLGSTSSKIQIFLNEQAIEKQSSNISACVDALRDTLGSVGAELESNQNDVVDLLQKLLFEFSMKIPLLGLEHDQEAYLIDTLDDTVCKAQTIIDSSKNTNQSFTTITRLLEHLSGMQTHMMTSMKADQNKETQLSKPFGF